MFVRTCWKPRSEEEMWAFAEAHPWALLINNGDRGPHATNLPLLVDRSGRRPKLVGHIAAANEHAEVLRTSSTPTLAVFQGPAGYVTASWYPQRDMPSTWYYTAVHVYGKITVQDEQSLRDSLETLTNRMESQFPDGWKTAEVPAGDITRRLKYIVGFEIEVERIEGKFKLGQDEPKKDAMAAGKHFAQSEERSLRELGALVFDYNSGRNEE